MGSELPQRYFIYSIWLGVMGVDASSWTAKVPSSVSGLQGSCIIIPCSFNYPEPKPKPSRFTGVWLKDSHEVVYHPDSSRIFKGYRGRTTLVGDLWQKNCSLRITPLHLSDKGPFFFRIEMEDLNKYSYIHAKVSIAVSSSPDSPSLSVKEEVKVGGVVSASCSVFYTCPSEPPLLTWSHTRTPSIQSQQLVNGQWELTSSLTFTSTMKDNKALVCTAEYRGGKKVNSSKTLNIKYAPVDVKVEVASNVKEGTSVELKCSSNSNPAPHSFRWHNSKGPLPSRRSTIKLERVTRLTEALYCTAINTEGQGQSSSLKVHVEYRPEIRVGSACTADFSIITCLCIVDWEPPGMVQWSLPGRPLPSTKVERHGSLTIVTLQRTFDFFDTVQCNASNTYGNATLSCSMPTNYKMLMQYVSTAVGVFVVVLILIPMTSCLLLKKCGRRRNDQTITILKDTDVVMGASSDPAPLRNEPKHITSEITNYYTNDHLYGNMEVEDDSLYMCVGGDHAIYENI
ncbi:myelin-associated glycoprotein isoform X2 [Esox lucius]|nr:myelin-associated glycoprotein isoform X2 [Esox lucius]